MFTRFIGDVHGLYKGYKKILKASPYPTIQIGDMGVGFFNRNRFSDDLIPSANPPYDYMIKGNHRFIRGNHDNPGVCKNHSQWIKDGHMETTPNGTRIMYVGGAWSIDAAFRTEGLSWWKDEELSVEELYEITTNYIDFKPNVMVTHDFPGIIAYELFLNGTHKPVIKTRTGQAFEAMLHYHHPDIWIAGHWHSFQDRLILGTRFICLDELQTIDIDLEGDFLSK